ncbi:hypothetical protein [Alsobacter soli]|uniref:hypothetical protein n=1 Tax=Alsobacter soli TaxID=2109933 RepID=UPI001304B3F4|nr:hypothetical protein [Alsobacter soli]
MGIEIVLLAGLAAGLKAEAAFRPRWRDQSEAIALLLGLIALCGVVLWFLRFVTPSA